MKIDSSIILFLYLFFLAIFVIKYLLVIDEIIGGFDNCLICTKVHFNGYLTNWSVTHFIAFLIAGYISPKSVYYIILAGILWEVIELYLEYNSKLNHDHYLCKKNIIECKTKMTDDDFWPHYFGVKEYNTQYVWCSGGFLGSVMDIIVNTSGLYLGIYIHELIHNRIIDSWEI